MRILVADDDPVYRSLLEGLLSEWDFEVVLASDGSEAWEILRQDGAPDLIILDWMMPGLDGFQVARNVRDTKLGEKAYILLITSNRRKEEIMKTLVCGADDYLMKPFDPMDLKIHLRAATRMLHLQKDLDEMKRRAGREEAGASEHPAYLDRR